MAKQEPFLLFAKTISFVHVAPRLDAIRRISLREKPVLQQKILRRLITVIESQFRVLAKLARGVHFDGVRVHRVPSRVQFSARP